MRLAAGLAFACLALACAGPAPLAKTPTQGDWDHALARLARLRAALPHRPYTQPVTVDFFEPRTRRHFDGRGAVGVDPGHAMRMILVGPAGEPALDVWVTRDAWRLVVPALHLVRRGGREAPNGSPVGFFRSWFVEPLAGRLLALGPDDALVVRDPFGGTLHVTDAEVNDAGLSAVRIRRRSGLQTETFAYATRPGGGGHARYADQKTGLAVEVTLGAVQREPPEPEAFRDPDGTP